MKKQTPTEQYSTPDWLKEVNLITSIEYAKAAAFIKKAFPLKPPEFGEIGQKVEFADNVKFEAIQPRKIEILQKTNIPSEVMTTTERILKLCREHNLRIKPDFSDPKNIKFNLVKPPFNELSE